MTGPVSARLPGGRLHLQHGPIDLVIGADGAREAAFKAAEHRFATVLQELVPELPMLRAPVGPPLATSIARRMRTACAPHAASGFVTPMAAVAGAVADDVLAAMCAAADLRRAYVNNGGDIALHLAPGTLFRAAMAGLEGAALGQIEVTAADPIRGIATSGQGGRSLSLGLADSVTVLAGTAATADVAATLIANAVDLPAHPEVRRTPACEIDPDTDLGDRAAVTHVGTLSAGEVGRALASGAARAREMLRSGLIHAAALHLRGQTTTVALPESQLADA
ncbi:MAG: UPF0280 family protein [Pseudomonadota bacterium]